MNMNKNDNFDRSKIPQPVSPGPFNFPDYDRFTLANGMEVIHAQHNRLPLISLNLCVRTGALIDPQNKEGLANLTTELLLEGTKKRTSTEIADQLDYIGAGYSVHADWNALYIEINVMKKYLAEAADMYADIIRNSVFPQNEFKRIRHELIIERQRSVDNPNRVSRERFLNDLYSGFRYALPAEGTTESLQRLSRNDIISFYNNTFNPANATLIIVGDISKTEVDNLLNGQFTDWEKGSLPQLPEMNIQNPGEVRLSLVHKPGSVQSEICLGHLGLERSDPDYYNVTLMNEILGGYFSSRLNLNLREKHGYTYGINSLFSYRKRKGPFFISTSVFSDHTADAIGEIFYEIDRLRDEEVSDEELESVRGYLTGIFPVAFETADQIAAGLANIVIFGLPADYYRTFRDRISAVSKKDILLAAQKHIFPENMQISVTGDRNIVESALRESYNVKVFDVHGNTLE